MLVASAFIGLLAAHAAGPANAQSAAPPVEAKPAASQAAAASAASQPQACNGLHERVTQLLSKPGSAASGGVTTGASGNAANATAAKGYYDHAVALFVKGRMSEAAAAALLAVNADWQPIYLAGAGTMLSLADHQQDALQFLLCARDLGDRSAYLLEALAALDAAMGKRADAREAIDAAEAAAPNDAMIDIEKSFLDTGKPPPTVAQPTGPLEKCAAELDRHMSNVANVMTSLQESWDKLEKISYRGYLDIAKQGVETARGQVHEAIARAAAQGSSDVSFFNNALSHCVTWYGTFTNYALEALRDARESMFFWAQAVGMTPAGLSDDTVTNQHPGTFVTVLSKDYMKTFADARGAALQQRNVENEACPTGAGAAPCTQRNQMKYCSAWQSAHDRYAAEAEKRINLAERGFDPTAAGYMLLVKQYVVDARSFAARQFRNLKQGGPKIFRGNETNAQMVLENYGPKGSSNFDQNLAGSVARAGEFVRRQASGFERDESFTKTWIARDQRDIDQACTPEDRQAELNALQQALWQASWDKLTGDVATSFDANSDCSGNLDGILFDVKEDGGASLGAKWQTIGAKISNTGEAEIAGSWEPKGEASNAAGEPNAGGVGAEGGEGGEGSASIEPKVVIKGGTIVGVGVGGGYEQGPIKLSGDATYLTEPDEGSGRDEPSVVFTGTASIGLSAGGAASIWCNPGSGSLKVYPRSFVKDATAWIMAH